MTIFGTSKEASLRSSCEFLKNDEFVMDDISRGFNDRKFT